MFMFVHVKLQPGVYWSRGNREPDIAATLKVTPIKEKFINMLKLGRLDVSLCFQSM